MSNIQLSDLLESYPPNTTPGIQRLISAKKEFEELSSDLREPKPKRGEYLKHQRFTHRAIRAFGDFLIIDEAGTGKSCSVLGFMESCRKEAEKAKINPSLADEKLAHYKSFIILSKGKTQKSELRNQLACVCSDGHYETGMVQKATDPKIQKTNLTLEIKKAGYQFTTYKTFTRMINRRYPIGAEVNKSRERGANLSSEELNALAEENARLAEDYADTVFWIDEGHNIPADPNDAKYREKQYTYATLHRIFHLAKRSKRIITTATPMINETGILSPLMNLILPQNGILPPGYDYYNATPNDIRVLFPKLPPNIDLRTLSPQDAGKYFMGQMDLNIDLDKAPLEDVEPYYRGRIEFIRAANTGAIPEDQGILQRDFYEFNGVTYQSQLVLWQTNMSDHQSYGRPGGGGGYQQARGKQRDKLRPEERQASNFVFPDGYWGEGTTEEEKAAKKEAKRLKARREAASKEQPASTTEGFLARGNVALKLGLVEDTIEKRAFRRYVISKPGNNYEATPEFLQYITNLNYIRTLSSKYAEILRIELESPGNAFVYFEYVKGSGAVVFALCLEALGFERYDGSSSMFEGATSNELKPLCSNSSTGTRRPRIPSRQQGVKPRYALLTQKTSDLQFANIREAMNSYENRHGDYIKILVSSRVGRDAININNVLRIHLAGAEWNQSTMYQALSRGVRATSHEDLLQEERQRLISQNLDPEQARITVKIFKHSTISADGYSVDLEMYHTSEKKDRAIKRVMRMMKQCAIGCQVHYDRNIRADDIDYSATCDYDICRYRCVDPPVYYYDEQTGRYVDPPDNYLDYSTYDVLYANEVIKATSKEIFRIYSEWNALTLANISNFLPQFRPKHIVMALESIINNKLPLTDRFGYTCYLKEDKESFFLDREYPIDINASYAMSYYTQGIIGIEEETLADIVVDLESSEHQEVLRELENMRPSDPRFNMLIDGISIEGQVTILENVIIRYIKGDRQPFLEGVITKFQRVIFTIHEPLTELNRVYESMTTLRSKRGRKKNPDIKRKTIKVNTSIVNPEDIIVDTNAEIVVLHTLYSQVFGLTAYSTIARTNKGEGRTRLLKPSLINDGWRDLNEIELPVYNVFIQLEISKRLEPFREKGVYGFVLPDGKFRISNKLLEGDKAKFDPRSIRRGKVCKTWNLSGLIDIMWEIGVESPPTSYDSKYFGPNDKDLIIKELISPTREKRSYQELATWDMQKLMYYYGWHEKKYNTGEGRKTKKMSLSAICDKIKAKMEETGRLLE